MGVKINRQELAHAGVLVVLVGARRENTTVPLQGFLKGLIQGRDGVGIR